MIVPTLNEEVNRMTADNYRQQVYIVAETQMHVAPWLHDGEGWQESRLHWAVEAVCAGHVRDTGLAYEVQGDTAVYAIPKSALHRCPCPAAHYGPSQHCKHRVALELYIRMQQAYPQDTPLPLPPTTPDERLRQSVALSMVHDSTQLSTHHTPQEDRMDEDDAQYIPEPDDAPIAVVEAKNGMSHETPATEPTRVTIPAEYVMSIKGKRHVLYAGLVIGAQRSGLVSLAADWTYNDAELSLAHAVATFADGRRYEDSGDASPSNVNKGIATHFRRVALTRAKARCLRDALGIQECSVEELEDDTPKREVPDMTRRPSQQEYRQRIWQRIKDQEPLIVREEVGRWVHDHTGLALLPDNYAAILDKLGG